VLLVESATTPISLSVESISSTRRPAWSFTSTLPFGSCRTAASERTVSVLVAVGAGNGRIATFGVCAESAVAERSSSGRDFIQASWGCFRTRGTVCNRDSSRHARNERNLLERADRSASAEITVHE